MVVPAVAQGVLPGPEAAAKAAAAATNKKRQQAEAAITQAVADALHLISLIRQVVVLLSGGLLPFILANKGPLEVQLQCKYACHSTCNGDFGTPPPLPRKALFVQGSLNRAVS